VSTTLTGIFNRGGGGCFDLVAASRASADMSASNMTTTTMTVFMLSLQAVLAEVWRAFSQPRRWE